MNRRLLSYFRSAIAPMAIAVLMVCTMSAPANAQAVCTGSASLCGQWAAPVSVPVEAIHMNLLPSGKVLFWGPYPLTTAFLWDPVAFPTGVNPGTGLSAIVNTRENDEYAGFCSGHVLLPNGQVIVLGGLQEPGLNGIPDARIYDYTTDSWTADGILPDMTKPQANGTLTWPNGGRYYPTATVLPSGNVLVISGNGLTTAVNSLPQIWQYNSPSCSTSPLPTTPLPISCWLDLTTAMKNLPLYPKMFAAPNGNVFYAGPTALTQYLNLTGTCNAPNPKAPPVAAPCWATPILVADTAAKGSLARDYGPAVLYDATAGDILLVGGGRPPTNTAETISLTQTTPKWAFTTGSMAYARRQVNGTILADGTVLITGGSSNGYTCTAAGVCTCPAGVTCNPSTFDDYTNPVYPAELYNPGTQTFTVLASMDKYRGYHSTALLLPDARVLSSGGDFSCVSPTNILKVPSHCNVVPNPYTAEIFTPPYLETGAARPTITSAPTSVTYNQEYTVQTPNAASITQVTFIRLGTVTHTFNENQRINYLSFTPTSGGGSITITTPATSNVTPPGHYMLFILQNGVPSEAAIIQIQ
jgi:hypothetical protein